jgi:josephin
MPPRKRIHHEQQRKLLCGLHAVNALLQYEYGALYEAADFDDICLLLSPPRCCAFNPHKSPLGLGNYDVNVLLYALSKRGLDGTFHDVRTSLRYAKLDDALGLLINSGESFMGRHWYAVRKIEDQWWDLNSLNPGPRVFGNMRQMFDELQEQLDDGGSCIIVRSLAAVKAAEAAAASAASAASAPKEGESRPAATASTAAAAAEAEAPSSNSMTAKGKLSANSSTFSVRKVETGPDSSSKATTSNASASTTANTAAKTARPRSEDASSKASSVAQLRVAVVQESPLTPRRASSSASVVAPPSSLLVGGVALPPPPAAVFRALPPPPPYPPPY